MMFFYKLKVLWRDPRLEHAADYEVLIRLARRCAYDFAHATEFIPEKTYFMGRDEWDRIARSWVTLFAKGNPGKDYRIKREMERDQARRIAREAIDLLIQHNIEVPEHMQGIELPF